MTITQRWGGEVLRFVTCFANSIVFKQHVFCSFSQMRVGGLVAERWFVNFMIVWSLILKLTLIKRLHFKLWCQCYNEAAIFIQTNITMGKKLKTCQERPNLVSGYFIKVFQKTTTYPRQPLLSGPKSGRLIQVWLYFCFVSISFSCWETVCALDWFSFFFAL